jgi:hypothetical protein
MDPLDISAAAKPEEIAAAVVANVDEQSVDEFQHGAGHGGVSVRTVVHKGHEIVIHTQYEILVDGEPFDPHVVVDNAGRVHYHGLPTRDFPSLVDLVAKAIDTFPDDFPAPTREPGTGETTYDETDEETDGTADVDTGDAGGSGDHDHGDHDHGDHDHGGHHGASHGSVG